MENVFEVYGPKGGLYYTNGNGFYYKIREKSSNRRWKLQCKNRKCRGTAALLNPEGDRNIEEKSTHTCDPDMLLTETNKLREKILNRCKSELTSNSEIFRQECTKSTVRPEVAAAISFKKLESTMYKTRRNHMCSILPNDFAEFSELIESAGEKFEIYGTPFFSAIVGEGENESMVFTIQSLVSLLTTATEVHIDGTFKCLPDKPNSAQLMIMMATHQNHAFPVVFALMKRKAASSYKAVFQYLKSTQPNFELCTVISDYEKAIKNAVAEEFPLADHHGCWFHYCQSIYRNVQKIGLSKSYEENDAVKKAVNMLMALALLPPIKVEDGLREIKIWLETHVSSLNTSEQEMLAKLLRFFETQWMGNVGARSFSVFGQKERTNNCQENFHRQLNSAMGRPHPSTWKFLGVLVEIARAEEINYIRLQRNEQLSRPRKIKWVLQDQAILRAQKQISANPPEISVINFLTKMAHRCASFHPRRRTEVMIDEELTDLNANPNDLTEDYLAAEEVEMYANYRTVRNFLSDTLDEIPSEEFCLQQFRELKKDLEACEGNTEHSDGNRLCQICHTNNSTRLILPCGHYGGCHYCMTNLTETVRYFAFTGANGSINDSDRRLPIVCPRCRAIVGKFQRVYE